jgi:MFS family permease
VNETAAAGTPGAAALPAAVPLRRNSRFRLLWIGQVLSDTGTEAALIAYPLLILALTHSAVIAGAVGTVRLVAQLVLGLPGGALSDRFDRRRTMIACDSIRAAVLGLLAGLVLAHLVTWPVVLAVSVIDGAANVLFDPSASAALPGIVADEQLERAWAATEARAYGAGLAGPALGGFLFALGRAVPFLGDALSYLVSAGMVSRIRGRFRPERTGERTGLWREAAEGIRLVWSHQLLRAVVIQAPLVNFAFNGVIFTITLALRQHGTAPGVIGLAQAGIAGGGLLGALAAPRLQGRLPLRQVVITLTVTGTALFAVAALLLPSPLVAVPVAVTLLLAPAANAALFAAMLRATPDHMRGRVNSTVTQAAMGLATLAPLTAGLLVQHFSGRWALTAFAAAIGAAAILCTVLPGLRDAGPGRTRSAKPQ